jgi:hypothetical protein
MSPPFLVTPLCCSIRLKLPFTRALTIGYAGQTEAQIFDYNDMLLQ